MNRAFAPFVLGSAFFLSLAAGGRARAQTYECETSLGTNCQVALNDAWFRFGTPLTAGLTTSSIVVLPGACDPADLLVDVDVSVDILHSFAGDLELQLTHPDGTSAILLYRPGIGAIATNCPSDDVSVTFDDDEGVDGFQTCEPLLPALDGVILPFNPLSVFDGRPRNGTWTLTLRDVVDGEQGVLRGWALHLPCVADVPRVSLEVTDGVLYERGRDTTATVTVVRTGDASAALDVVYEVVGTATSADYEALSGEVTIPAGATSATIEIVSVDDDLAEIDELIVVRLVPEGAYQIGGGDSATVTLIEGNGGGDGGCGCSVRGQAPSPVGLVALAGLALLVRRRRARAAR